MESTYDRGKDKKLIVDRGVIKNLIFFSFEIVSK